MSEHIAWMTFEPGVCAICSEGGEDVYDVCSHKCYVQMYERMLRHNCFRAIVLAACEVAQVQQAMLDRGWIPPEEPMRYTDGTEPPQPPRGQWLATEYVKQHDSNLSMSVEMGAPGTWAWYLRDERLKHWVAATGSEATSAEAREAVERKLAEYEASHDG